MLIALIVRDAGLAWLPSNSALEIGASSIGLLGGERAAQDSVFKPDDLAVDAKLLQCLPIKTVEGLRQTHDLSTAETDTNAIGERSRRGVIRVRTSCHAV